MPEWLIIVNDGQLKRFVCVCSRREQEHWSLVRLWVISLVMMWQRAHETGRAASREFSHCTDSYGNYVSSLIWITNKFRGSPYIFGWIRGVTHLDLDAQELSEFQKLHTNFWYIWFVVHMPTNDTFVMETTTPLKCLSPWLWTGHLNRSHSVSDIPNLASRVFPLIHSNCIPFLSRTFKCSIPILKRCAEHIVQGLWV